MNNKLSGLRILITNDDSINANGIKALERIANFITPDVWVVAPEIGQSGKGLSVTFESALRVKALSPRKYTVSGTPADCVYVALGDILKDKKPDLVLSGINHGFNVADFIAISGTVGAAFAAASQGIKAIAVSQDCGHCGAEITKFPLADHFLDKIIKKLMSFEWPNRVCMNVNLPSSTVGEVSGVKIAKQGKFDVSWNVHKRLDPVDDPYYWLHAVHTDVSQDESDSVIISNKKHITVSAIQCRHDFDECDQKLEELFSSNV